MTLYVDEFEPTTIEAILGTTCPVVRTALNRNGFADYMWHRHNGEPEQVERKQCPEAMGDLDAVEEQIGKHLKTVRNTILLIEGAIVPQGQEIQTYKLTDNARYLRPVKHFKSQYARYEGWKWGMEQAGVTIWPTNSWEASAVAIAMMYKSAQNPDHTTLARHLKPIPDFHPNPMVQTLMNVKGVKLGPERAEAITEVFDSIWQMLNADPDTLVEYVHGIGRGTALAIFKAFGKNVS